MVLTLITEIEVFLNGLSMSDTVKYLLEQDQGCRVAVEPMSIIFRQKVPDRARRACVSFLVLQKPGVPAKLPVIPFALLLVDAVKWPGRFTKNQYQLVALYYLFVG